MNNYEKLYWLTRLEGIQHFSITMVIVGSIFIAARFIYKGIEYWSEDEKAPSLPWYNHAAFWPIYILSIASLIFVPTQKEAIIIFAGGKTIDFIEQDSSITKIPAQTTSIISMFMEKQIMSLQDEIEEKKNDKNDSK